jgi:hypothetical protein
VLQAKSSWILLSNWLSSRWRRKDKGFRDLGKPFLNSWTFYAFKNSCAVFLIRPVAYWLNFKFDSSAVPSIFHILNIHRHLSEVKDYSFSERWKNCSEKIFKKPTMVKRDNLEFIYDRKKWTWASLELTAHQYVDHKFQSGYDSPRFTSSQKNRNVIFKLISWEPWNSYLGKWVGHIVVKKII